MHGAFGFTVGVEEVGGIDCVDAEVPYGFDDLEGGFFVDDAGCKRDHDLTERGRTPIPFRRTKTHGPQP